MNPDSAAEPVALLPPLPPSRPVTDAESLCARVSGERPLQYVETGLVEAAETAAVRWAGLGRLRDTPGRIALDAPTGTGR